MIRTFPLLVAASAAAISALAGCKWSEFDDLEAEAWANSTERPDNGSSNWGVAIQRGRLTSDSGGTLTVLGTAASVYDEISYDATGGASIAATEVKLESLGVGNLDPQPILLGDPASDSVALVTRVGNSQVRVIEGSAGQLTPHDVFGADSVDAAAFMVAPGLVDANPQPAQPIFASADTLFATLYTPTPDAFQPKCQLVDQAQPVAIRALAAVRPTGADTDDLVVWGGIGAASKLYLVPGAAFNGDRGACPGGVLDTDNGGTPLPQLAIDFQPDIGSQVIVFDGHLALLQGHNTVTETSHLAVVDLDTMTAVGNPQAEPGLRAAAVYEDGARFAAVAGYPLAVIDGVESGKVIVYDIDPDGGIDPTPVELLHDAQPEDGQAYGRSVAVTPFNGAPVIAVAASNEAFLYFRTSTLYADDTRQGR